MRWHSRKKKELPKIAIDAITTIVPLIVIQATVSAWQYTGTFTISLSNSHAIPNAPNAVIVKMLNESPFPVYGIVKCTGLAHITAPTSDEVPRCYLSKDDCNALYKVCGDCKDMAISTTYRFYFEPWDINEITTWVSFSKNPECNIIIYVPEYYRIVPKIHRNPDETILTARGIHVYQRKMR